MSVYIKGEEFYKPTACAPCKLRNWCQLWKQVVLPAHITHPECPIIEVSEHGDLIDRQAFRYEMDKHYPFDKATQSRHGIEDVLKSAILQMLFDAPTIIPADKEA